MDTHDKLPRRPRAGRRLLARCLKASLQRSEALVKSPDVVLRRNELVCECPKVGRPMRAGSAVGRANEHPATLVLLDQTIGRKRVQRPLDGHQSNTVLLRKFPAGGQTMPRLVPATTDRLTEVIGDLYVWRSRIVCLHRHALQGSRPRELGHVAVDACSYG